MSFTSTNKDSNMINKKIVLDCDGVILDYNHTWGNVLSMFLKQEVKPKNLAYHAHNVFDYHMSDNEIEKFHQLFHEHGWIQMQALEGALEAISIFSKKNFTIDIVTSIPQEAHLHRKSNLENLGIIFSSLHTVGFNHTINPKKDIVNQLKPLFFVDDLLQNFEGIEKSTACILIDIPGSDNPNHTYANKNDLNIHSTYLSLLDFAKSL